MASEKRRARITLIGCLTLAVGRFRFYKDKPVTTDDSDLIDYCENKMDFRLTFLKEEPKVEAPDKKKILEDETKLTQSTEQSPNPDANDESSDDSNAEGAGESTEDKDQVPDANSDGAGSFENDDLDLNLDDDGLDMDNQAGDNSEESPQRLTRKS